MIRLEQTSGGAVAAAINAERHRLGSPTTGMVLTLLIIADEDTQSDATGAAAAVARQHPMRIITLIPRADARVSQLDAEISVGGDDGPGEVAVLRLRGELAEHGNSVAIPLLLPDTPVVAYWPGDAPAHPADDPIGRHSQRRITDAAGAQDPWEALRVLKRGYQPGDTDLAWARCTQWRSVLAAAFDAPLGDVRHVRVEGERNNPSVILLGAWLGQQFGATVETVWNDALGISSVSIDLADGLMSITRQDEKTACIVRPGRAEAQITLARRSLSALIAEELRRLDPDDMYGQVITTLEI
ncbi:MAG: glucose-6-phosphate dehydrogenase assembly protein OpcA [Candidatus Nanopelagicales bacterium]|nr:glucose-6-phosphate dehydrogenase assembly protein OpcA [Candidatus Nanopelagicales bacterium]